jgi:transcriptional regulator with XRE-family HTH domain
MNERSVDGIDAVLLAQAKKVVGERLRQLRKRRGWSQDFAASYAGTNQAQWSRVETGDLDARLTWLLRAQELFEVESLESLFGPLPSRILREESG